MEFVFDLVNDISIFDCFLAFSDLTMLAGQQEGHPAYKKSECRVLVWLSVWTRCRFAYGPADATATDCLLLQ